MANNDLLRREFERARATPYKIPTIAGEPINTCYGKNQDLCDSLSRQFYPSRLIVAETSWDDIFAYLKSGDPSLAARIDNLAQLPHTDFGYHIFSEVYVDGVWRRADATLERDLSPPFPLIEWDGTSDSQLAVPVVRSYDSETSSRILLSADEMRRFIDEITTNKSFYNRFNDFVLYVKLRNTVGMEQ